MDDHQQQSSWDMAMGLGKPCLRCSVFVKWWFCRLCLALRTSILQAALDSRVQMQRQYDAFSRHRLLVNRPARHRLIQDIPNSKRGPVYKWTTAAWSMSAQGQHTPTRETRPRVFIWTLMWTSNIAVSTCHLFLCAQKN